MSAPPAGTAPPSSFPAQAPSLALARGTAIGVAAESLVLPVGLVIAALLTRSLGAGPFGQLSLVFALIAPVSWTAATVFAGRAAITLVSQAADWRSMAALLLRANVRVGVLAAAAFALLAPLVAAALGDSGLTPYLWIGTAEIVLLPAVRLHRDVLIARGQLVWPAAATASYHAARLVLIVAAVAAGLGTGGVLVANAAARLAELAACRLRLRIPLRGTPAHGLAPFRAVLGNLFVYALSLQIFNRLDLVMLAVLRAPADALGHFGAAQSLAMAPGLVAMVLSPMLIAALRQAHDTGPKESVAALRRGATNTVLALWALIAPVAAGADSVVVALFGAGFAPAGLLFAWLATGAGGAMLLSVLMAQEIADGHYRRPLVVMVPMVLLAFTLHMVLIPRWGAAGAAASTATSAVLAGLGAAAIAGRERIVMMAGGVARAALAGALGAVATRLASDAGWPFLLDVVAGLAVSAAAVFAVGLVRVAAVRALLASLAPSGVHA